MSTKVTITKKPTYGEATTKEVDGGIWLAVILGSIFIVCATLVALTAILTNNP